MQYWKEKYRVSCATGVQWDRCFRIVSACAFVDYDFDGGVGSAAVRVPGGRWKTGNAAYRIDSHALPRRSEYWSRRPPAHGVRYVATPHDKESFKKKKKHLGIYPTKCTTAVMVAGVTSSHIKDRNPFNEDQDEYSCLLVLLFLFSPLRTKCPKSVVDYFPLFFTIYMGRSTASGVLPCYRVI